MRQTSAILAASGIIAIGCASWFMNGGKLVESDYAPKVKASYRVPTCTNLADGSSIAGPADITFLLVEDAGGPGVFERSPDGTGAVITNRWSEADGEHYFGWVQANGWEYIVPSDPSRKPTRVVYTSIETKQEGTVTKPTSAPAAKCDMLPN
jgi:hypothetical protein